MSPKVIMTQLERPLKPHGFCRTRYAAKCVSSDWELLRERPRCDWSVCRSSEAAEVPLNVSFSSPLAQAKKVPSNLGQPFEIVRIALVFTKETLLPEKYLQENCLDHTILHFTVEDCQSRWIRSLPATLTSLHPDAFTLLSHLTDSKTLHHHFVRTHCVGMIHAL